MEDWVQIVQAGDAKCMEIIKILNKGSKTPHEEATAKEYVIKQDCLYRQTEEGLKWVVPQANRAQLLRMYHDDAGHPGVAKTEELVRRRCWFPKMRRYIQDYTHACLECLYVKPN